jgi:hypothetical protein
LSARDAKSKYISTLLRLPPKWVVVVEPVGSNEAGNDKDVVYWDFQTFSTDECDVRINGGVAPLNRRSWRRLKKRDGRLNQNTIVPMTIDAIRL